MFFVFVFTVNVTVAEDLHCIAMVSAKKSSLLFYWMSCILNGLKTSKLTANFNLWVKYLFTLPIPYTDYWR